MASSLSIFDRERFSAKPVAQANLIVPLIDMQGQCGRSGGDPGAGDRAPGFG